jgi:uncharacterized protein YdhG (YjbR/CyaY superfamily)
VTMPDRTLEMDAYLAGLSEDAAAALQHLREVIRAVAPDAVEGRSYGMPAFRYRGRPLVGFAAAAQHLGFYPMDPALIEAHASELDRFSTSKGTIRFTAEAPIPDELVAAIVRERVADLDAAKRG